MVEKKLRSLSQKQIDRCEQAKEPKCVCRCGGTKHGGKRVKAGDIAGYEALPVDDPHHLKTKEERREEVNARNRAKTEEKNKRLREYYEKRQREREEFYRQQREDGSLDPLDFLY